MNPKRVLLVEDEDSLGTAIEISLSQLGLVFVRAKTIKEARAILAPSPSSSPSKEPIDFILLDRTLPDGDGLELCPELRAQGNDLPILVLSARGEVDERVQGLRSGADDYLAKPFSWDELSARITALSRRARPAPVEAWHSDAKRLEISGPLGTKRLTPLEYKLAMRLIGVPGEIVSRDVLLKEVWGFSFLPKTRTVDYFLSRLRKHFEKNPEDPVHFLTIRGAGYQFKP